MIPCARARAIWARSSASTSVGRGRRSDVHWSGKYPCASTRLGTSDGGRIGPHRTAGRSLTKVMCTPRSRPGRARAQPANSSNPGQGTMMLPELIAPRSNAVIAARFTE